MSDIKEVVFKLDVLKRYLENFDPEFFANAVQHETLARYIGEAIDLLKGATMTRSFPFGCCSKCMSMRPYVNQNMLYSADEVVDRVLVVGCEHEQQCRVIYEMLKDGDPNG